MTTFDWLFKTQILIFKKNNNLKVDGLVKGLAVVVIKLISNIKHRIYILDEALQIVLGFDYQSNHSDLSD